MKQINKKDKNYGIAILRVLLSYMVVIDHFYNKKIKKKYKHILYYHIPTFFLISFYYTHKTFATFNIDKIKLRFQRLVIPYIMWNLIAFLLNNIYYFIAGKECIHTIKDFFITLLYGNMLIVPLWFQNILIFTSIVITIITLYFKNIYLLIFQILIIISFNLQYTGENYNFFHSNFPIIFSNTYGRFIDTLPHSLAGFFIGIFNIPNKLNIYKCRTIISGILIILFISKYNWDKNLLGFKYGGTRLNIAAIFIFLIFFSFPIISNKKIKKYFDIFSNYTAGIYFVHYLIGRGYIVKFILSNKIETLYGCLILYIISYCVCFLLDKIIGNTHLKHLIK